LECLGHVRKSNDVILKTQRRTNKQETTTRQTKDQMERHIEKEYETGRRECDNSLDVGQREMERLTSSRTGPRRTVKLLKKNYNKSLATLHGLNWFYKKYSERSWVIIFRALLSNDKYNETQMVCNELNDNGFGFTSICFALFFTFHIFYTIHFHFIFILTTYIRHSIKK